MKNIYKARNIAKNLLKVEEKLKYFTNILKTLNLIYNNFIK